MAKQVKKKVKIKWVPLLIMLVVGVGSYFLYQMLSSLPITNIYIMGNSMLKDQEIIVSANLENYPSLMESKIRGNPYVQKVKVNRKIWGQVYIHIEEAEPLLIDTNGGVVLSNGNVVANDKMIVVSSLINYTPDVKYEELLKQLYKTERKIRDKISEIQYVPTEQDKDRFAFYMNDGNLVYLTLTKFRKIDYYNTIIGDFPCQKGVLNLDSGNHFEIKESYCGNS